jgi:predicted SnoaL-like aldol condensation-catalyzing enzyme
MSVEGNKAVVRRFHEELFNQQNLAVAAEIMAPNFSFHGPDGRRGVGNLQEFVEWTARCLEMLPDYHIVYSDMLGEDDMVAFRWTVYATHKGGVEWIFGSVAEDTKIEWSGIDIFHFADGKIVKYYASAQDEDVRKQLQA